jgi:hypothetical protein
VESERLRSFDNSDRDLDAAVATVDHGQPLRPADRAADPGRGEHVEPRH